MAIEHIVKLKTDSVEQFVEYLDKKLYHSCKNDIRQEEGSLREFDFSNEYINVFINPEYPSAIEAAKKEYGVDINCCVSFHIVRGIDCNSEGAVSDFLKGILKDLDGDILVCPKGDEPVVIRRAGKIIIDDDFFSIWFGEILKRQFEESLRELM